MNLLFIGTPAESIPSFARAVAANYGVYAVDGDKDSKGLAWVRRHGFDGAVADVYDPALILQEVRRNRWEIDAIMAIGVDVGPVVSQVACELGLPHIPYEIAKLSWNKQALKDKLRAGGIAVPGSVDYVVKPVDGRGSRGVHILAASNVTSNPFVIDAIEQSPNGRVLFERYIQGPGVSAESIIWNGQAVFTGLTDRHYTYSQVIESGGHSPSKWEGTQIGDSCHSIIADAIRVLGIQCGTIKWDLILDSERCLSPVIIECAIGRMGGGGNAFPYLSLGYNVDVLQMAFDVALGKDPRPPLFYNPHWQQGRQLTGHYQTNQQPRSNKERGKFKLRIERR